MKFVLFLIAILSVSVFSQPKADKFIKDQYIVVLKDNVSADGVAKTHRGQIKKFFKHAFNGYFVYMTEAEAARLRKNPNVKFVEQNRVIMPSESTTLWNLDRLDQRALPLDSNYNFQHTGQSVYAYVIDSGIYYGHADFEGRAVLGQDYVGDGQNGNDCFGHGSHVAGSIGSRTYGVAKGVNLVSMRIGNCSGGASISSMISSIDWVIANGQRPAVINISYTAAGASPSVEVSINSAYDKGVITVVAAGNSAWDACAYTPAGIPKALTVSATGDEDSRWLGANYGSCVDLLAPGLNILSVGLGDPAASSYKGGTSMAAPHVVGAIALYLQQRPLDNAAIVSQFIVDNSTPDVVLNANGSPNKLLYSGFNVVPQIIPACGATSAKGYISAGQTMYYPNINGASGRNGLYTASVTVGQGVTSSISLQKKQGSGWQTIASGTQVSYQQTKSGTYRYMLTASAGNGGFIFCYNFPI